MTECLARVNPSAHRTDELLHKIANACMEVKAKDVVGLDVREVFDLSDYFVVATGRSDRQVQGIANRILSVLNETGTEVVSIEGFEDGHWILIDTGDIVVHVFYESMREHYDIEALWARAKKVDLNGSQKASRVAA